MSKYQTKNENIKIGLIKKNPWNPNQMDKKTLKAEKESIEKYGVVAPIIVRPLKNKYQIIDGEHRYRVCNDLGYKKIPSVIVDGLEDKDKKKFLKHLEEIDEKISLKRKYFNCRTRARHLFKSGFEQKKFDKNMLNWD